MEGGKVAIQSKHSFDWDVVLYHCPLLVCFMWLDLLCMSAATTPWFEAYRESFLQSMPASDHEFLNHYLACILLVLTKLRPYQNVMV
jgi:hypothetical protein